MFRKIKIGIETGVADGKSSGFGVYTRELANNLDPQKINLIPISVSRADLPTWQRIYCDQLSLPFKALRESLDILHQPAFSVPIIYSQSKKIITVHDLIPLLFPGNFSFSARLFWRHIMPYSFKFADHIITVSNSSKRDIVNFLGIPEEKITVTHLGVSDFYRSAPKHTDDRYVLFVSTLEPRKQPLNLLRILVGIMNADLPHRLVIAGKRGWGLWEFDRYLNSHPELKKRVSILGYVSEEEKLKLYQQAELLLFPSLYEGFGLPVLEAMSSGCPVLASNSSSLPEIVGQAGVLIDPKNIDLWVKETVAILKDRLKRQELREAGILRSKKFSWQKCAKETEEVYERVYEGRH